MLNKILIDNCKCKIIFLITGMKHIELKAVPRKYKSELRQLKKELQEYIGLKEYRRFFAERFGINPDEMDALLEAEGIIEESFKKIGDNDARRNRTL